MKKLVSLLIVCALLVFASGTHAYAVNLLQAGDFEAPGGSQVPQWTLQEFVTGSMAAINSAELVTSATAQTPTRHLFNRPFVGGNNTTPPEDDLTNSILLQSQPIIGGQHYTFSGWSRFEANYAGGVTTLSGASPQAGMPSPTTNSLVLEFLDASNTPVGEHSIDVKADRIAQIGFPDPNDNSYYQHVVSGTAPANATQARVKAQALNMIWNGPGAAQSQFYDTFSLTKTGDPTELLLNPTLDDPIPSALDSYTQVEIDPENPTQEEIFRTAGFANRPASGGALGLWISSFFGGYPIPTNTDDGLVSGTLSQTVSGTPGLQYSFTSWSRWETNYSGGQDILAGGTQPWMGQTSPTQTKLELAFLDSGGGVIGTATTLDLKAARQSACGGNANSPTCGPAGDGWVESVLMATAPAGTAEVRVSGILVDGVSTGGQQSAFWDDWDLSVVSAGIPGDFDDDGDVDGRDFLVWQKNPSVGNLSDWQANYGTPLTAAVGAVPEPGAMTSILIGLAAMGFVRRK